MIIFVVSIYLPAHQFTSKILRSYLVEHYYWENFAAYGANFPTSPKHFYWEEFSWLWSPQNRWKLSMKKKSVG